jgi:hypothetical protein
MSTSFGELPDFLSAALKLSTVLYKVDQGYHVQSDIRRKTQLHETILSYISIQNIILADFVKTNLIHFLLKRNYTVGMKWTLHKYNKQEFKKLNNF